MWIVSCATLKKKHGHDKFQEKNIIDESAQQIRSSLHQKDIGKIQRIMRKGIKKNNKTTSLANFLQALVEREVCLL